MQYALRLIVGTILLLSANSLLNAQEKFTISGYVSDIKNGETLIGANIYIKEQPEQGTITNHYGFYSLTLPAGDYTVVYSYLGFSDTEKKMQLSENQSVNVKMEEGITMQEVVVTAEEKDRNVESTEMGTVTMSVEKIKTLPVLLGEVDILKTLQLLPGVQSAGEGSSGFYVRGGGPDQNLILLDEAVVYNSGHLLGFFSVFNSDAIKNTTLIKGGMPASYGGRLSSVVDVQMKEGNDQHFRAEGGIGLIASRLTFEGPIVKEKSSFIVSARRTYGFDLAQPFVGKTDFAGTNYYFYDVNAKINYRFSEKDRLYLSAYFGRDVLKFRSNARNFFFDLPYGNETATLRWNHLFSNKLFMNLSAIYNQYEFQFVGGQDVFKVDVYSGVRDYNGKLDFDYYLNPNHSLKFGGTYTYHKFTPNIANGTDGTTVFSNDFKPTYAHDAAIYIQDDWKINTRLSINMGLRGSMFQQTGPYTSKLTGRVYEKGEPVKTYWNLEPRMSGKYTVSKAASIKAGVTFTNQYIHLVSNSTSNLPSDVWVPSSEIIEPQLGVQYALGYFQNLKNNAYETSVEIYYKDLKNQIDYRETYVPDISNDIEASFVFGTGKSYGMELFFKKNEGQLTGWVGYTLSKTDRTFPEINDGKTFPATYDRTHDLSVVANYEANKRFTFGAAFIYGTGNTFTPLKNIYFIEQGAVAQYGVRNSARIEPYHRLDLSATWTPPKQFEKDKDFISTWTLSVYSVYNRRNPFFISYDYSTSFDTGTARGFAYKVSLFPIIPSITWNFKWR